MPKSWKMYERKNCDLLSQFFFGIVKPPNGRIDKDLPLCRAADSGSHPSEIRRGDIVPNGKWIRENTLRDIDKFPFVIELKYVPGIALSELFLDKSQFYKHWEQAYRQALETGSVYVPLLIINKQHSSHDYVVVHQTLYFQYARSISLPKRYLSLVTTTGNVLIFLLSDWIAANPVPPYQHLIHR